MLGRSKTETSGHSNDRKKYYQFFNFIPSSWNIQCYFIVNLFCICNLAYEKSVPKFNTGTIINVKPVKNHPSVKTDSTHDTASLRLCCMLKTAFLVTVHAEESSPSLLTQPFTTVLWETIWRAAYNNQNILQVWCDRKHNSLQEPCDVSVWNLHKQMPHTYMVYQSAVVREIVPA